MAYQIIILASVLAYANAGFLGAPAVAVSAAPAVAYSAPQAVSHVSYSSPAYSISGPEISSQSSNIYRTFGNLGQVSTYSKTLDTPFSSVRKSDLRVTNHGLRLTEGAPIAYAAQSAPLAYAAHATPLAYAAQSAPLAYAAPAGHLTTYHAPAGHLTTYHAPAGHLTSYHAPAAVSAAPAAIGVAYSSAPSVSHVTYNGLVSYAW